MAYIFFHVGIILAFLLDALFGYLFFTSSFNSFWFFVGHLAMVFLGTFCFKKMKFTHFNINENFTYIAFAFALTLPAYGLLGMYGVTLAAGRIAPKPYDDDDLENELPLIKRFDSSQPVTIEQLYQEELDIEAYRDIFSKNDRLLEEIAINRLSKMLTRESVAILKDVVKHSTSDSKILAATALIEMEGKIIKKIDTLRQKLAQKSSDAEMILELARIYDLYCFLNVLDEVVEKYYHALAIEQYRTYLIQRPKDPQATLEYGRTLLHHGDLEKATKVLQSASSLAPHNPNPYIWLAEAHFIAKEYSDIKQICNRIKDFSSLPEAAKPVMDLWVGEEAM